MIRRHLVLGMILAAVCAPSAQAYVGEGASDSIAIDSGTIDRTVTPTTPVTSPPVWHPTRADTLMFQSVQRHVKPDAAARVFSRTGVTNVQGHAMTLQGVRGSGPSDSILPWSEVAKVQVRGSAAGQGAIVGGILFGAAGFIAMASMTHDCGSFEIGCGASSGDVVTGTLGAFAIGSLVGAVVAAPFHKWKDVHLDKKNIHLDQEGGTPGRSPFDDLRRGFTIELDAGLGGATGSDPFSSDANTGVSPFTRFRLGHGLSERWALAYVNDAVWSDGLTGITGLGASRFTSAKAPSLTLELTGGVATRQSGGDAAWNLGVQAGLGFEFSRHWLMRASLLQTSFNGKDHSIIGTSIGRLWY